jgi:hypothetical protein
MLKKKNFLSFTTFF